MGSGGWRISGHLGGGPGVHLQASDQGEEVITSTLCSGRSRGNREACSTRVVRTHVRELPPPRWHLCCTCRVVVRMNLMPLTRFPEIWDCRGHEAWMGLQKPILLPFPTRQLGSLAGPLCTHPPNEGFGTSYSHDPFHIYEAYVAPCRWTLDDHFIWESAMDQTVPTTLQTLSL